MTKLILLLLMSVTFFSCQEQAPIELEAEEDGGRNGLQLTAQDGIELYNTNCMSCHGDLDNSAKRNRSAAAIRISLQNVGAMEYLKDKFSRDEIDIMAEVLSDAIVEDPNTGGGNTGGGGQVNFVGDAGRGANIFNQRNCIGCHTGNLYDQIRGATISNLNTAITEPSTGMGSYFDLTAQEKYDLVEYMKVLPVGGGDPDARRASFRDSVYQITSSNSCVGCHSSGVRGIGSNNLTEAYNVASGFVNFANMPNSKLVRTIKGENPDAPGHQVFSDQIVIQMQAAINKWKEFEAPDGSQNATPQVKAFRDSVYVVTRSNCLGCHRNSRSRHASDDLQQAYSQALLYVNFNDPDSSVLRTKALGPGHGGGSYPQAAEDFREAIRYWRAAEEAN